MSKAPERRKTAKVGKRPSRPGGAAELAPRQARRERRRDQSREEILAATRRVLLQRGLAATTLDAVAQEVGVSKAALYYYFPSKDALFFEVVFGSVEAHAKAVHAAVESAHDGADALRAIIRETMQAYATRLDDFRLIYMHSQVAAPGAVQVDAAQIARVRPLNDLTYGGATKRLGSERRQRPTRARVEPRLLAFLAHVATLGVLTMKGMVESFGDPLLYSDDELAEGLARVFEAAARP